MIKNYFKIAWRNIIKNKTFSFINIIGLTVGLAVFILIMLWVKNETSYDRFHKDNDRIGMVMQNQTFANNEISSFPAVPSLLAGVMKKDLPGVELASPVSWGDVRMLAYGDKTFSEYGLYVGSDFLKIFSIPILKGATDNLLKEPHTLIINETLAQKYFGNEDPVGKIITVEKNAAYKVVAVFKDFPANSSLKPDFLMPVKDYIDWAMGGVESWESMNMKTYVKLAAGLDRKKFDASFKNYMNNYAEAKNKIELFIWDLKDWYLRFDYKNGKYAGGGRITYVKLFIIIAVFILLLACINFMNLSTARATQRGKEVGIRKSIGASKRSLLTQFISESVLLALLSAILALVLVSLVLPLYNNFLRKEIFIDFNDTVSILVFLGIILITGLVAGSYPALVLSSFKPVKVLKSTSDIGNSNTSWIRKGLVVTQFVVSVLLIIGTLVIHKQVNYIKDKKLGYNKDLLIWFPNTIAQDINTADLVTLKNIPGVQSVARGSMTFTSPNNRSSDVKWSGKKQGDDIFFNFITADHHIIETMGIEMKEGRAFSTDFISDTTAYILNEEAVKRMGLSNPVGQIIETNAGKGEVVGIARDFHIESMHYPISPVIIQCRPEWTWLLYARIDGKNISQTLQQLEQTYKNLAPGFAFNYQFQDKEYEKLYRNELQIGTLVNWFAFFAIFISCLGLLGLTVYTVERKRKEIGIRKVLGASVSGIITMVARQFLLLIVLAVIIAAWPAWYFMNNWLQNYSYRIKIPWDVFVVAGAVALGIALLTISILAVRAALANPVKSLRAD